MNILFEHNSPDWIVKGKSFTYDEGLIGAESAAKHFFKDKDYMLKEIKAVTGVSLTYVFVSIDGVKVFK